jgi:hypothetical protein
LQRIGAAFVKKSLALRAIRTPSFSSVCLPARRTLNAPTGDQRRDIETKSHEIFRDFFAMKPAIAVSYASPIHKVSEFALLAEM